MSPTGVFDEASNPPSSWATAPAPSAIAVTPGSPARVVLEWPNYAITNRWLQVQVLPTVNTGLANTQVFYLGHLLGELDGTVIVGAYRVLNSDLILVLPLGVATVNNNRDVDKSGFVLNADGVAIRNSLGGALRNITIPVAGSAAEGASSLGAFSSGPVVIGGKGASLWSANTESSGVYTKSTRLSATPFTGNAMLTLPTPGMNQKASRQRNLPHVATLATPVRLRADRFIDPQLDASPLIAPASSSTKNALIEEVDRLFAELEANPLKVTWLL